MQMQMKPQGVKPFQPKGSPCIKRTLLCHNHCLSKCERRRMHVAFAVSDPSISTPNEPEEAPVVNMVVDGQAEEVLRKGWDPEGVFSTAKPLAPPGMDLFAARAARKHAATPGAHPPAPVVEARAPAPASPRQPVSTPAITKPPATAQVMESPVSKPAAPAPVQAWVHPLRPLPPAVVSQGGVPGGVDCPEAGYIKAAYHKFLSERYISVDLDTPGLRVLHLDPPVLVVDGFWPQAKCEQLMATATATGVMTTSKIGAGNAGSSAGANAYDARRTSSSMLMDPSVQARFPALAAAVKDLQRQFLKLLQADGRRWGQPGWLPSPGQCCFESPQVAKYETGQHFLAHEDAFPVRLARNNGFQRRATLLLYLNDVEQGGYTCFDHLAGMAVQPRQGRLLIFFPSTSDARADERTLHTAMDAADTKWVMQQWVASGVSPDAPPQPSLPVLPLDVPVGSDLLSQRQGTTSIQAAHKTTADSEPVVQRFDVSVSLPVASSKGKRQSKKGGPAKKGFGG